MPIVYALMLVSLALCLFGRMEEIPVGRYLYGCVIGIRLALKMCMVDDGRENGCECVLNELFEPLFQLICFLQFYIASLFQ